MDDSRRLLALCALRVGGVGIDWGLLAREAQEPGGLDRLYHGEILEYSAEAREALPVVQHGLAGHLDAAYDRVAVELDCAERAGARLATVLDQEYPAILRQVANLPPFLFIRGTIRSEDALAVAVVGTRQPSETGLARTARLTTGLVARGVTIVSGLAKVLTPPRIRRRWTAAAAPSRCLGRASRPRSPHAPMRRLRRRVAALGR